MPINANGVTFFSISEAVDICKKADIGVASPRILTLRIDRGELPAENLGVHRVVRGDELEAFIARRKAGERPKAGRPVGKKSEVAGQ